MAGTQNPSEKRLRKEIRHLLPRFWLYATFSGIISLMIQVIGLIPTILMQRIIDRYIPNKEVKMIVLYIILFCCIPLAATLLSGFYRYQIAIICRNMGLQLAIKGFTNLTYQPVSYFDKENSSELATYCRGESIQYIVFWMIDIPQLIATGICGILVFSYLVCLNWVVALFLLLYIPVAFLPSNGFANKVKNLSKNIVENNAKMAQIINDTFRGIKTVKAMVLEKLQIQKLKEVNEKSVLIWSKVALYDNMSGIWVDNFSDSLFTGVTFGMTAYLIVMGKMTLGSLIVVLNYTGRFLAIVKQFMHTNYNFKAQLGEYDKLFDILTMPISDYQGTHPFQFHDRICFSNVTFAYTEERGYILKSLDFVIKHQEWLGIVGASGAGKTTIFDLLLRFYSPQIGRITIDGTDLQELSPDLLRAKVAKVSQDTFLFPGTIKDNLLLANPDATDAELNAILKSVCLDKFVSGLHDGLNTDLGEDGLLISGGERQKLGLAQGLLRDCEVILLDEVTANIDRDAEREIKDVLKRLKEERKLTIITISHRIDFLQDVDRIVVLENGRIKEETSYAKYAMHHEFRASGSPDVAE